jgi:UDP-N-acetylmuramoyl-tripeptide--D-alanyl-D-alanine ligase
MKSNKGRLNFFQSPRGFLVADDSYNANPASMKAGIEACREIKALRRIAVIGAMGELGQHNDKYHFELGELLGHEFSKVFICGAAAQPSVSGALNAGLSHNQIVFKDSSKELIAPLIAELRFGDLVFIKGSLSANMQIVVDALTSLN